MDDEVAIPIVAILMPLVLVPTVMVLKHRARKREREHAERMRALDLGVPVPQGDAWPALAAIAVGFGVPVGSFFCAWMASLMSHDAHPAFPCAMIVGLAGVVGGTKLAGRLLASREPSGASHPVAHDKPAFDPDAYDVAGRRG